MPPPLTEFLVSASGFETMEVRRIHPKEDVDLSGLRLDGVDDTTHGDGPQRTGRRDCSVLRTMPSSPVSPIDHT